MLQSALCSAVCSLSSQGPNGENGCQCREDVETAAQAGLDAAAQRRLWRELASAAESGWDFSSRWLADGAVCWDCSSWRG